MTQTGSAAPVIKGVTYFLGHVPGLTVHGSKPSRELEKDPELFKQYMAHLRPFEDSLAYAPNQIFIGNMAPDELAEVPTPWHTNPVKNASREGGFGEIMPEDEFYGLMKICDEFDILMFDEDFILDITPKLEKHPLITAEDIEKLGKGTSLENLKARLDEGYALPLYIQEGKLVGCCQGVLREDPNLAPDFMLENLAFRASGMLPLRKLTSTVIPAADIDYLVGCGEEAVGDRYNRGGGNMAKAIGEMAGCIHATGSDTKAFCCGPVHAMVVASGLVASGIFDNVVIVAGGSLAKLGMKFQGHLKHDMPVLEDCLGGFAIWLGRDDGKSPVIRLDSIGKQEIGSGSSQQAILEKLVVEPLDKLGLKLSDVDKYATEMHNPELTEPQGSGNVPLTNYRIIGSFAVLRKEIAREDLNDFVKTHGMLGFSPTQGHVASAIPVLGHAVKAINEGKMERTMFLAKGSLFLGRMTQLSDGISFILEKNSGGN